MSRLHVYFITNKATNKLFINIYFSYDIWDDETRHKAVGFAMKISGICSPYKYTIITFMGFNRST